MKKATFTFTAGRLLCSHIRYQLDKAKLQGHEFDYVESPGFLEREFVLTGDYATLKTIENWIRKLA